MVIFSLFSLISAIICFSIAHLVFIGKNKTPLIKTFVILCLSFACWGFSEFFARQAETAHRAKLWQAIESIWPLTAVLYLHFVFLFSGYINRWIRTIILPLTYTIGVLQACLDIYIFTTVPVRYWWGWGYQIPDSALFHVSTTISAVIIIVGTALLVRYYRSLTSAANRKQIIYILIGTSVTASCSLTTGWLLPLFSIKVPELTVSSLSISAVFFYLAIYKFKLFALSPEDAAGIIVKTMSDALIVVNLDRKIEIVNNALLVMLGYTEHELLGKHPEVIIGKFTSGDDSVTRLLRSGIVSDFGTYFRKKNGESIPISLSWSVLRNHENKLSGIVFVGRDISEREKIQQELQKAREELERRIEERTQELRIANEQLQEKIEQQLKFETQLAAEKEWLSVTLCSIGDGVITTNSDGYIISMNPAAEHLTGWLQQDASGKHINDVYSCQSDTNSSETPPVHALSILMQESCNSPINNHSTIVSKDGLRYKVAEQAAPILDSTGNKVGYVIAVRDITERIVLEEELFKAKKLESINLLAGGIAHDFNNLLTSIVTNLFMAKMELPPNEETAQLITNAEKAAFRASNLTKQLLIFSKTSAPPREKIAIKEFIESSVGFYLSDSKSDYKLEFGEDLSKVVIDRGQFDQVLNNLVNNADEAMPDGGTITVDASNFDLKPPHSLPIKTGKYVRISISDTGEGIDNTIIHRIFDPYFTTRNASNGLGLTSAFAIVQKHGGHITVESTRKRGTVFNVFLPASEEPHTEAIDQSPSISLSDYNILLMDDEETIRLSIKKVLKHLGYDCVLAESGEQALQAVKEHLEKNIKFKVIILDLTVHGGKGAIEIVDELRTIDPDTRIIVSSGYANDKVITDYQKYGFHAAITKPYTIENLADVLSRCCKPEMI
ncbi:MAG: PAS domain S-box protein [Chitinispirillaceae bacterium]|nr:PAS domain S-box protein [Chitinispirillaceae bacterium]